MTLTVRLDPATASALDRYCAERGVTKSRVVQESLAVYLVTRGQSAAASDEPGHRAEAPVSAAYKAFADAGFIGAGAIGGGSADKAAVRAMAMKQAMKRIRRNAE